MAAFTPPYVPWPVNAVLCKEIAYNTTGITTAVYIGTVPANSQVFVRVHVNTAFNDSGTDQLSVGYGASYNELLSALDVSSTGLTTGSLTVKVTANKDIYVKYAGQNSNASAGAAVVEVIVVQLPQA